MSVCLGTNRTGVVEFRILSRDKVEDALAVQSETMRQECIAVGMGMYEDPGASEEMQSVFREVIKDGCTVIAVNRSDRVVAVAFNKLHVGTRLREFSVSTWIILTLSMILGTLGSWDRL